MDNISHLPRMRFFNFQVFMQNEERGMHIDRGMHIEENIIAHIQNTHVLALSLCC